MRRRRADPDCRAAAGPGPIRIGLGRDAERDAGIASDWQPVPDQETVRGVQFLDVAWTGRRFVAVGSGLDGNGAVVDSSDGLTWHRQDGATPGSRPSDLAASRRPAIVTIGMTADGPSELVLAGWPHLDDLPERVPGPGRRHRHDGRHGRRPDR